MKKITIALLVLVSFTACKKTLEDKARDIVIDAMTSGQWRISLFTVNGNNITTDFAAYTFQYHKNETVDAIKNGSVEVTGNWEGDANNMSISANFSNVSEPLLLINGNWKITNNSWTFVEAKQTNGSQIKTLRLDKL
ncbi:MAG: hypothetical protein H0V30_14340 [Chitinophagaceae bacterium]|jgi:DUF4097 and DUF4098 domain-containing protein YvlB|nr:hypothetical protein [Chitinophagaceae bacterium]